MRCPFTTAQVPVAHLNALQAVSLGPASAMLVRNLILANGNDPNLPRLHAVEGKKFLDMVETIFPVKLAANWLVDSCQLYPTIIPIPKENVVEVFGKIISITKGPKLNKLGEPISALISPAEAKSYFSFCCHHPELLLGSFYVGAAIADFASEIARHLTCPEKIRMIKLNGMHFFDTNLIAQLPLALHACLQKTKGQAAKYQDVDGSVVEGAFRMLKEGGHFYLSSRPTLIEGKTRRLVVECPMEDYLSELLVKESVMVKMLSALDRAERDFAHFDQDGYPDEGLIPLACLHSTNRKVVMEAAESIQL